MTHGTDDSSDKGRRHRRYEVEFDVEITAGDWEEVLELSTQNVSRGGLFIRSMHPVEAGTRLQIKLRLPDGATLEVEGDVVHVVSAERAASDSAPGDERKPGFGLRFDQRHALDLSLLEAMAASYTGGRHCYSMSDTYIILPTVLRRREDQIPLERTAAYQLIDVADVTAAGSGEQPVVETAAASPAEGDSPAEPLADGAAPASDLAGLLANLPDDERLGAEPLAELEDLEASLPPPTETEAPEPAPSDSLELDVNVNTLEAPAVSLGPVSGSCAFGIDFGTSYTSIALLHDGQIRLLPDDQGRSMIPTVVCYREGQAPLVGWGAREEAPTHATSTVFSPKRLLGRDHDDPAVGPYIGSAAFETLAGPNGQVVAEILGDQLAIPQICAEVFRELARIGERSSGVEVRDVVLSAPVTFGPAPLAALRRSAELAGLRVLKVVDEPVAAAVAYGRGRQTEVVAVYDFGGGTFDFTLLEIADHRFRVMARAGDGWLGGDDFDSAIAEQIANSFWRETEIDLRKRQVEWQRLLMLCEETKRRLSTEQHVELSAPGLVNTAEGPLDLHTPLDRESLEEICGPLVDRSLEVVQRCIAEASLSTAMIDQVVLTGGVTRMPLVRERVQDYFGREIGLPVNPEHAVVIGDAIYASHLVAGRSPELAG